MSERESSSEINRRALLTIAAVGGLAAAVGADLFAGPSAQAASLNGRLTAAELTSVPASGGSTVSLGIATASAWSSLVAACRAATGVTMVVTAPHGGYRDLAAQQYMYENPQGPVPIAPPGSSSHGMGTAVDIYNRQYSWLQANAARFGFIQTYSNEPWHWQYTGATSVPDLEEIMALKGALELYTADARGWILVGPGVYYPIGDADGVSGQEKIDVLVSAGIPSTRVSTRQFDVIDIIFKRGSIR